MDNISAAVIGSGFGGLAVAIRLQAAGCQTVVFEKRAKPGGRAYVYESEGFTFDAGPTVITAPECLRELFSLAGKAMSDYIELLPVRPFIACFGKTVLHSTTRTIYRRSNDKSPLNLPVIFAATGIF
jgi:phytoene dehydrogenase-like protein